MTKRIIRTLIILIFASHLFFCFTSCTSNYKIKGVPDSSYFIDSIPKEYIKLINFKKDCCTDTDKSIKYFQTIGFKYRSPISYFYFTGKYLLQIYCMSDNYKYSLKAMVHTNYKNAHSWINEPYVGYSKTDMEFYFKLTKPVTPKNIYIDINGQNTRILKNDDSTIFYYSLCKNFNIKFNPGDQNDIYGNLKDGISTPIPLEIMLTKQGDHLYMLIYSSQTSEIPLEPYALNNLLQYWNKH